MLNVSNLPRNVPLPQVRQRVEQIMENCGGRLVQYQTGGNGLIKFPTPESAQRYPIHSDLKMKKEECEHFIVKNVNNYGKKVNRMESVRHLSTRGLTCRICMPFNLWPPEVDLSVFSVFASVRGCSRQDFLPLHFANFAHNFPLFFCLNIFRALLRMEGEDVFGCKISLQYSTRPVHEKEMIGAAKRRYTPFPPPPNPALVAPPRLIDFGSHRHLGLEQDDELRDRQDPITLDLHNTTDLVPIYSNVCFLDDFVTISMFLNSCRYLRFNFNLFK